MKKHLICILLLALSISVGCSGSGDGTGDTGSSGDTGPTAFGDISVKGDLSGVKSFMYQIQHIWHEGAVDKLAATRYDMLVIEPTATQKAEEDFDMAGAVKTLKASAAKSFANKLVFAYVDIGEAEEYRSYWNGWTRPTNNGTKCGKAGNPDFIIRYDPDGWAENYPVAFWDERWIAIMKDIFKKLAEAGFDGAYLDWVEAYQDECVAAVAKEQGIDPAQKMVDLIATLKTHARKYAPDFMMISQNAMDLAEEKPDLLKLIEGQGVENIYFDGDADAEWDDADHAVGDIPQDASDTEYYLKMIEKIFNPAGIPVFSIDYAVKTANVNYTYTEALKNGLVPLVTQISLSDITTTPPPGY